MAGGTRVVLPAPVGARSTTAFEVRRAATTCGRTLSIGKGTGIVDRVSEEGLYRVHNYTIYAIIGQ